MKFFYLFFAFLPVIAMAELESPKPLGVDFSGNVEAQSRESWNNPDAKDFSKDWKEENFSMIYGNLSAKTEFRYSRIEVNWFVRHAYSQLYSGTDPLGNKYFAPAIYNFPTTLVSRNMLQLVYKKQENNYQTDSVLNKFYYEWDYDDNRFVVGRMFINYGLGEVFNPINPFNQPTGLTNMQNVAQGNDGLKATFFVNDHYTLDFYMLGDKNQDGYEGQLNRTLWAHGEYQINPDFQFDFVVGEDQKRNKLGIQLNHVLGEGMIFMQTLYTSELVNKKPSNNLWDVLLGYDNQLTSKWHLRSEAGYQKKNQYAQFDLANRFLPSEYFISFANQYEVHSLVKLTATIIHDFKTHFGYGLGRATYSVAENWETELFVFTPVYKGTSNMSNPANAFQRMATTDVGFSLRTFF